MEHPIFRLATCEIFRKYCYSLTSGNDIYKDLINDVIIILHDKNIESENVDNLARVIAWREFNNKYSDFNKQFGLKEAYELTDNIIEAEEVNIDEQHHIAINVIDKDLYKSIAADIFPFQHDVFKTYQKLKTIRAVAAYYNIPRSTIHRWIKDYRERITTKINNYEPTK
jgi:hypothetical protein